MPGEQYNKRGRLSQRKYPNERLIAFMSQFKGGKVLELGCGTGANLWYLAKEGFDAYGIDLSRQAIKYTKETLEEYDVKANVKQGDMTKLAFKDNSMDFIVDIVSMQHLTYQQHIACLDEIHRCLKPKGYFFSFHLGKNTTNCMKWGKRIDIDTIDNIREGNPLSNNGTTCFLDRKKVSKLFYKFDEVKIERVLRSYGEIDVEYLIIEAIK